MKTLFNVPGMGGEVNVHEAMHASNPTSNAGLDPDTIIDTGHRPDRLDPGQLPPGQLP